jgi:hypothetical protein
LDEIEFGIKKLEKWKSKYIERNWDEIIKIGSSVLIHHIYSILNLVVKHATHKPCTENLIMDIFKSDHKTNTSNYNTVIIRHILEKFYGINIENNINFWL